VIKSRRKRCEGLLTRMGGRRSAYRMGRPDGKWPLGRPRLKGDDNIKMYIQEVEWGIDWIDLAQERDRCLAFVNVVMNFQLP
jgi:hypothetical protein